MKKLASFALIALMSSSALMAQFAPVPTETMGSHMKTPEEKALDCYGRGVKLMKKAKERDGPRQAVEALHEGEGRVLEIGGIHGALRRLSGTRAGLPRARPAAVRPGRLHPGPVDEARRRGGPGLHSRRAESARERRGQAGRRAVGPFFSPASPDLFPKGGLRSEAPPISRPRRRSAPRCGGAPPESGTRRCRGRGSASCPRRVRSRPHP